MGCWVRFGWLHDNREANLKPLDEDARRVVVGLLSDIAAIDVEIAFLEFERLSVWGNDGITVVIGNRSPIRIEPFPLEEFLRLLRVTKESQLGKLGIELE